MAIFIYSLMKIIELKDGLRRVDAEGSIIDIGEERSVNLKAGGEARVQESTLQDDSGSIKLSLWNDHIDSIKIGSKVIVGNGYVNSWQGEIRLNVGRYGSLTVDGAVVQSNS